MLAFQPRTQPSFHGASRYRVRYWAKHRTSRRTEPINTKEPGVHWENVDPFEAGRAGERPDRVAPDYGTDRIGGRSDIATGRQWTMLQPYIRRSISSPGA